MSPPIPWPHPLAVNLYAHIASRNHFPCLFSPPISSHSVAPTPSAAVRKLAHPQRLLLPSHPLANTPSAQPSSLIPSTFFSPPIFRHSLHARRPQPSAQPSSSPAASSPHPFSTHSLAPTPSAAVRAAKLAHPQPPPCTNPFPATPLHPRRPQPSAQASSLIPSGFFLHPFLAIPLHPSRWQPSGRPQRLLLRISSHSLAPTPSAAISAAKLTHSQRLFVSSQAR